MKKSKNKQRFLSILLIIAILSSLANLSLFSTAAAESEGLIYSFANDLAGYAEGIITLNSQDGAGANYYLYWADDEGALEGYYSITSINTSTETNSFSFLENIVIPPDATKVIAIKSDTQPNDKSVANASYVFDIPVSKQNKYTSEEKTLSFEALSDTQVDQQSSVFYTYSEDHFAMALEDAAKRDVDFVTMSGDCINNYQNGTSKEWQAFQKIIADSSFTNPIYETNGNHSMNSDIKYGLEAYITATGQGIDTEGLGEVPYYEMTAENGDHFLFVALEGSSSVPSTDEFSDEQMDWLDATIAKYYNDGKHIFVFEHAFFHGWGPGDDKTEHYYSGGLRTTEDFPGNQRFLSIMNKYTEVFLYTGHSHLDFMYNWNYDNENGQTANMFHIPATACTTHVTNGKLDYMMNYNDSQCYIVESYDDMVVSYGLNVVDNLIYPQYSYIVETSDYNHVPVVPDPTEAVEPPTESDKMIDVQIENGTSYLYDDGAVLYFYNVDSGNFFPVDNKTGIAQIPENATNLTLYRFDGEIGKGNTSDKVTTYWNKYGPATRAEGQVIFYVAGSTKYSWKEGEVVYPSAPATEPRQPTESEEPKEDVGEVTVYWAIPSGYTEAGYTYKMNIRCADGSYPHSALTMTDTGKAYNGMTLYAYTFPKNYAEEYDTLKINRIQLQGIESKQVFQYQWVLDEAITISELKDMVLVSPDAAPTGTKTATADLWKPLNEKPEEPDVPDDPKEDNGEVIVYWAIPSGYTEAGYTYKINIKCADGSYPHSALTMTDTGTTFNGMTLYAYTFPENYAEEYDTLRISRIQLQGIESKQVFQYQWVLDEAITISELKDMVFVSPDEAPTGTKTATADLWKSIEDNIPAGYIKVEIDNQTSYLYDNGAALYFYDNDTAEFYEVDTATGTALIPDSASLLTLYRFDGEIGKGNATDDVTTYWNKYGPAERKKGQNIFYVAGSSKYGWQGGNSDEEDPIPEGFVKIEVVDATSSGWVYGSGAALFLYDKDTGATYRIVNGYAIVPETAVNLVFYRCDGAWGSGNRTDSVTTYWNKWDLPLRSEDHTILTISGDSTSNWMSAESYDPEGDGTFYLVGYIGGVDYEARDLKFDENGDLETVLTGDSYVYVVSSSSTSYWTNGWLGNEVTSATLYRAQSLSDPDKLFVPSGKVKFKLVVNDDGTVTLSFAAEPVELDKSELEIIRDPNAVIGDVDSDEEVTIIDATLIQRYLAKIISTDPIDLYAADVFGNGEINITCATAIQRYLSEIIGAFPASDDYVPDTSTLDNLISAAGNTLYTDYRYASFVAYANLKAQYNQYKDVDVSALSEETYTEAYTALLNAYENFNAMKTNNNVVTVYFCNDQSWSNVKAYIYNSETGKGINTLETAQGISIIKTLNCGAKIYCVTIDRSKWDKIIFTDGNEKRTVELDIPTKNYMGYYFADSTVDDTGNVVPAMFKYTYDRI